jgi:hypothetical protein
MKRYFTIIVLLCVAGAANGAYFNYYAGGLRAFFEVEAEDSSSTDGPYSDTNDSTSSAGLEEYAEVTEAYSYAYNSIWSYTEGDSMCIQTQSIADGIADNDSSYASSWGYGRTEDTNTYGIYYQIMPDQGEDFGDNVIVYYNDTINISASGTTFAYLGGPGDMGHMAITRGQLPPVLTEPNSEYEVLTLPNLELSDEGGDWFSGILTFDAQIGDVIGIFVENYTDVTGWGPLDGIVENNLWIVLTVKTVLTGDLDNDGDVDLRDFSKLAENWLAGTADLPTEESISAATSPALKRYGRTKRSVRVYGPNRPDERLRRARIRSNGSKTLNRRLSPAGARRRRQNNG